LFDHGHRNFEVHFIRHTPPIVVRINGLQVRELVIAANNAAVVANPTRLEIDFPDRGAFVEIVGFALRSKKTKKETALGGDILDGSLPFFTHLFAIPLVIKAGLLQDESVNFGVEERSLDLIGLVKPVVLPIKSGEFFQDALVFVIVNRLNGTGVVLGRGGATGGDQEWERQNPKETTTRAFH